jgi:hypothetical protein
MEDILNLTVKDIITALKNFFYNPIVTTFIGAFVGIFIENNIDKIKGKSIVDKFWYFGKDKTVYIFTGSIETDDFAPTSMQIGDIRSFALILSTLQTKHPKFDFLTRIADKKNPDIRQQTIVSIGGGRWNCVTEKLYSELHWPLNVARDENNIAFVEDIETNKKYYPEFDENGKVIRTFGYFHKGLNPYNPDKYVYIVAGLSTYGVLCATKIFSLIDPFDQVSYKEITKVVRKRTQHFSVLVSADVSGGNVYNPKVEKVFLSHPEDLLLGENSPTSEKSQ